MSHHCRLPDSLRLGRAFLIVSFALIAGFSILSKPLQGAIRPSHASFALFNNAIAMPFIGYAGIIHTPIHPGFLISSETELKRREHFLWTQDLSFSFLHQRLVHSVVSLYTSSRFAWIIGSSFHFELALQGGYAHVINTPDDQLFKLENGAYSQTQKTGRASFCFGLQPGLSYAIGGPEGRFKPFLRYRFTMIGPFVKSYVPLLPNAALEIGLTLKIRKS